MPLPTPNEGETEEEFHSRCMANETIRADFATQEQRNAVCYRQWRENKATDPNVGGGVDREKLKDSDFVFPDTRTFPVVKPGDVSDAVSSWGRYRGRHSFEEFKRRLTALCRRKGASFVAALPQEWKDEKEKALANPLKTVSRTDAELRVANYIVLFGGRDLEGYGSATINADGSRGEYFTPQTRLESAYTKAGVLYVDWEHSVGELGDELLGVVDWKTARVDDKGVFVERVLSRRNAYVAWVEDLIEQGLIGTSCEAVSGSGKIAANGEILEWPLKRDSLTVIPMEPRMLQEFGDNTLRAFKALGISVPEHTTETEPDPETKTEPEDAQASVSVVEAKVRTTNLLIDLTEV